MSRSLAIARRELFGYLYSPAGYIIAAVFVLFTAFLFFGAGLFGLGFSPGAPASLRLFFTVVVWVFLFVAPAISMRTFSEELQSGTFETLLTSPVTEWQAVIGKFLGAFGFLLFMLLPTILYVVALEIHGRPDYGEIACGYLGLLLVGGAYVATGVFFSTLTSSQVVAYLVTLFFWLILMLTTKGLPILVQVLDDMSYASTPGSLTERVLRWIGSTGSVFAKADPEVRMSGFGIGLLDSFNIVYFVSIAVVALVAAMKSLEVRRWR